MKKKNKVTLRKKLDAIVSQYVRLSYADKNGIVKCYTCTRRDHWKKLQNGHFVPRQYLACRYDLRNLRPQCYACNMLFNGQAATFAKNLEEETPGIVIELEKLRYVVTKDFPYEQKLTEFAKRLVDLSTPLS